MSAQSVLAITAVVTVTQDVGPAKSLRPESLSTDQQAEYKLGESLV